MRLTDEIRYDADQAAVFAMLVNTDFQERKCAATGALGISSRIWATAGKTRRTATSMPPALTFRAVANSRNSFPFSSRLRTKTGMASGSLDHLRRSPAGRTAFMQTFPLAS